MTAAVAPPFQAVMVPSSPSKINEALLPLARMKPLVLLNTCPVGLDGVGPFGADAIVTTSGVIVPEPLYNVETPLPAFDTQKGLVVEIERPHGSTKLASVTSAIPGISETRLCWT